MEKKNRIIILTLVDAFCVITALLFAPLEMFLSNQKEFWFSFNDIIGTILMVTIGGFIAIFLLGIFLKGIVFRNYITLIFSGTLLLYLQGNFMNLDVGVMNGAEIIWSNYTVSFIFNLLIWIMGISFIMFLANKKWKLAEKIMKYLAPILTMMQVITIITMMIITPEYEAETTKIITNKDIFNVSEEENIIVFLLDMFDDTYFQEIIENEPELVQELEGFTYFSNSVGSYSTTSYSSAMLFTGQYLYNDKNFDEQYNDALAKSVMIPTLDENGYSIDVYMNLCIPEGLYSYLDNYVEGKNVICSKIGFIKRMYTLVACKYFPDFVKPYIWMNGTEFEILKEGNGWSPNNVDFYQNLRENGITTEKASKNFKLIYLDGVHYPYYHDENVNPMEENHRFVTAAARGALRIVQGYIDKLKEKNVYDNTAIVVIADHGYYWSGVLTNPLLLVKPMGASGEMKISAAPVCHKDFQPSILSLAGLNENMQYGKSYYDIEEGEERERLFYQYYLAEEHEEWNYRLIEYSVDSYDNKRENFHLTDVEYSKKGEKSTHKDKCQFCMSGKEVPIEDEKNWPVMIVHSPIE